MPKPTFFNLPADKRQRIITEAVAEFRDHSYQQASINRIVERTGIAKGSFYQYFTDKQDLFFHIMDLIGQEKMKYIEPALLNPQETSFFAIIREIYRSGIEFALNHPDYLAIGNRMMRDPAVTAMLLEHFGDTGLSVYRDLIRAGKARGELRATLDEDLAGRMLMNMQLALVEYYFEQNQDKGYSMAILDELDKFIGIMKFGFYGEAAP